MTRPLPTQPLLALLRDFDPGNANPMVTLAAGQEIVDAALPAESLADLNDGQYAALIDRAVVMGAGFVGTRLQTLAANGNLTLPVYEFQNYGDRGLAELDVWLWGAGQ